MKYTGLFDDDDQEIFLGDVLDNEWGYTVEVVKLTNGDIIGKLTDKLLFNIKEVTFYLNNGKGYIKRQI